MLYNITYTFLYVKNTRVKKSFRVNLCETLFARRRFINEKYGNVFSFLFKTTRKKYDFTMMPKL